MITEKGELDVGLDFCGENHTEFELRPPVIKDSMDAIANPKSKDNEIYSNLFVLSKIIIKLGTIPRDQITPELLENITEHDAAILMKAKGDLEQKLSTFRKSKNDKKSNK
jgi:hypothetical protein